jgi:hypothetical protein
VLSFVCVAGYLIQRPLANGFLLSRRLLRAVGALEHEDTVFGRLGAHPPRPHRPEVIVGALLGSSALLIALVLLPGYKEGTVNIYESGGATNSDPMAGVVDVSHQGSLLVFACAAGLLGAARLGLLAVTSTQSGWRAKVATTGAIPIVLLSALIIYGTQDHTPPAVEVDLPTGLAAIAKGQRTFRFELACDEACSLDRVQLYADGDRIPVTMSSDIEVGSERALERSLSRGFPYAFTPGVRTRWSIRLALSGEQLAWIQRHMKHTRGDVREAALDFTVDDDTGNRSVAWVPVVPDRR